MKNLIVASLTLAAAFTLAPAVHADEIPTMTVKYGDLDLSRPEGAKALYGRLNHAAQSVCSSLAGERNLVAKHDACISKAVRDAVAHVDSPTFQYAQPRDCRRSSQARWPNSSRSLPPFHLLPLSETSSCAKAGKRAVIARSRRARAA